MAEKTRMFSEHWYRVAGQRVALRPSVRSRRQLYRGESWRVLYDPFANQFFRLRPAAYDFVARLSPDRTVEEVWRESLERDPDHAPGQDETIRLLAQLYLANLLQLDLPPDAERFFERYRRRKQREYRSYFTQIMFARFPLLDPTAFLNKTRIYARMMFSRPGLLVWLVVLIMAGKKALDHADRLWDQSQGILAPGNLFLLYVGLVLVKTIHEFGHAFAIKRFDGEVHTMGVMLMIFTPIPYIDATASWAFRKRYERILVAASGMMVELFVAALALFIWAATAPGTLNALCYNIMFIASVSSILFNGNPLLRYDGYYILSDLLDIPNLSSRSMQQLRYLTEGRLLGRRNARPATRRRGEAALLVGYGILSGLYRLFVFSMIILFVSRRFLLAGIVMAVICFVSWVLMPIGKFAHYLLTDPALDRNRTRAIAVSLAGATAAVLLVGWIPFPSSFSAPGLIQCETFVEVPTRTTGRLAGVQTQAGTYVQPDTVLLRMEDPEWIHEWNAEISAAAYNDVLYRRALSVSAADLEPIRQHRALIERRLDRLRERAQFLDVNPPIDGVWMPAIRERLTGMVFPRGMLTGYVLQTDRHVFRAVVSQNEANWLFDEAGPRHAHVRLRGIAGRRLAVRDWLVIPADQRTLPSAALGWLGGGELAVSHADQMGVAAAASFFEVRANLDPEILEHPGHDRTGRIRFRVAPEPLGRQVYRRVRQKLQQRN